jgi:hypothetical protein
VLLIALVVLLGTLITPSGLARSHGSAAVAVLDHGDAWVMDDGHGHSHEDDIPASAYSHAHHTGDHSHDNAHALPKSLPGLNGSVVMWRERAADAGPWPSLDGLERPPRT